MGELAGPGGGGLTGILGGHGGVSVPKPFSREIFLIGAQVAGTSHVRDIEKICEKLSTGERLNFVREPKNEFDANAIVIKDSNGKKIGYVPMKQNEILARLMDAGKLLYGIVETKDIQEKWLRIAIQIYLRN